METNTLPSNQVWELPPLILHPFSDPTGPDKLVESSKAQLMLQGLLPANGLTDHEIEERLLDGRYCEIRMLFYVGRDLWRWIAQCLEIAERDLTLKEQALRPGSFAAMLIEAPPEGVKEKLTRWGVADYRSIFQRALGLSAMFTEVPPRETLAGHFIRYYYRYADQAFQLRSQLEPAPRLQHDSFTFELYASGEYSRLLEREWEEE